MRPKSLALCVLAFVMLEAPSFAAPPNPFRGRSPVMVAEQYIAEARTALEWEDGDIAARAIRDAIDMAERFQERRPSEELITILDACLDDIADGKVADVPQRAEVLREELAEFAVYHDTADALAAVNEAAAAAARGEADAAKSALIHAKAAVRVRPIEAALRDGRAALGAAYADAVAGHYRRGLEALDDAEAALRRGEHNVVLAQALAHVRHAEAATTDYDYRTAAGHAAKASATLRDARTHLDRETERQVYEAVDGLNSIAERAKQQNPNIWEEIPPLVQALNDLLHR